VLVLSFSRFEDIESSKEYKDLEKLTMSLLKLKKGGSSCIQKNKAYVSGKMIALESRGGMDRRYTMDQYIMRHNIQSSRNAINEWEKDQKELVNR